jgi:hypothetical protein
VGRIHEDCVSDSGPTACEALDGIADYQPRYTVSPDVDWRAARSRFRHRIQHAARLAIWIAIRWIKCDNKNGAVRRRCRGEGLRRLIAD